MLEQPFIDFRYRQMYYRRRNLRRIGAAMFVIYAAMLTGMFYMAGAK
jgi:hypothetical protein